MNIEPVVIVSAARTPIGKYELFENSELIHSKLN